MCADLSCLKKTHACISLSQQSCCSSKKKERKTLIAKSIYYSFQLFYLCEHRGARNLHSSPPLMHCCVVLRPNWNVGDYFMFHGTKGLKTIRKIIFSSLLVVFIHSFTMWVDARWGTWRQAINTLAVFFFEVWLVGVIDRQLNKLHVRWQLGFADRKNLLKLFCFAKLFMDERKLWGGKFESLMLLMRFDLSRVRINVVGEVN